MVEPLRKGMVGILRWTRLGILKWTILATLTLAWEVSGHWFSDLLGLDGTALKFYSPDPSGILIIPTLTPNLTVKAVSTVACTSLCLAYNCTFYCYGTDAMCHLFGTGLGAGIVSPFRMRRVIAVVNNAALWAEATSSPILQEGCCLPSGVVDGDISGGLFHSEIGGQIPPWIMLDLGATCEVFQIRVFTRKDYIDPIRFIQVAVMLSDDPPAVADDFSSFTTVHMIPGPPPQGGTMYNIPLTPAKPCRYVALQRQAQSETESALEVLELEVYTKRFIP